MAAKKTTQRSGFKTGEHIVYPAHGVGRIVGEEMHAADDAVGLEHEIATRGRRDHGRVVGEPERAGVLGQRPEIARNQALLPG